MNLLDLKEETVIFGEKTLLGTRAIANKTYETVDKESAAVLIGENVPYVQMYGIIRPFFVPTFKNAIITLINYQSNHPVQGLWIDITDAWEKRVYIGVIG